MIQLCNPWNALHMFDMINHPVYLCSYIPIVSVFWYRSRKKFRTRHRLRFSLMAVLEAFSPRVSKRTILSRSEWDRIVLWGMTAAAYVGATGGLIDCNTISEFIGLITVCEVYSEWSGTCLHFLSKCFHLLAEDKSLLPRKRNWIYLFLFFGSGQNTTIATMLVRKFWFRL